MGCFVPGGSLSSVPTTYFPVSLGTPRGYKEFRTVATALTSIAPSAVQNPISSILRREMRTPRSPAGTMTRALGRADIGERDNSEIAS